MKCREEDIENICVIDDHQGHLYFFKRKDQEFVESFYDIPAGFRFIDLSEATHYSDEGIAVLYYIPKNFGE